MVLSLTFTFFLGLRQGKGVEEENKGRRYKDTGSVYRQKVQGLSSTTKGGLCKGERYCREKGNKKDEKMRLEGGP